jgi:hypothetical protein
MVWQDHRYDFGYFMGGRIHPVLLAPRPNKLGYLLIISGLANLLPALAASASMLSLLQDIEWPEDSAVIFLIFLMVTGYGAVQLVAGFKLLQRPRALAFPTEHEDESPEAPWREAKEPDITSPSTSIYLKSRRPYRRKMILRHRY